MSHLPSEPDGGLIDIFKAYPELAGPLHAFAENLMRGECPLSAADRELIAVCVSADNGCDFCRDSHAATYARLAEGEAPAIDGLPEDTVLERVRPALRPLVRYARKLNREPAAVTRDDVDAVLDAGWDERALVYAAVVCGFFNLMNRWVEGLGIATDPAITDYAGQMLSARGYAAINAMLGR